MSAKYINQTVDKTLTRDETLKRARAWYARQLEIIAKAHGASWTEHQEWIEAYLKEEIRQRLWDLGWRPKA